MVSTLACHASNTSSILVQTATIHKGNKMDKIQKTAALKVFLNLASFTLIVIGIRVAIELLGLQVSAIIAISFLVGMLVKMMYEHEVDRARALDQLNRRNEGS